LNNNVSSINTSNLRKGVYVINFEAVSGATLSQKFIKE